MQLTRIRELIAEKLGTSEQDLAGDLRLSALGWDSLDFMELAVAIENEFDIRLIDARLVRCQTVEEVAELIAAALRQ